MHLEGQGGQRGYAMAALLVTVAVMGIIMTALLPVWRQQSQREKEAELLFRLYQYSRAIQLFRDKNGGALPPNIDMLVQGKYLRKKYKDPITGDDFQPIFAGQQPGQPGGRGGQPQAGQPQSAGIVGVMSKSTATSIRNHRGATTYNQWQVTIADMPPGPGFAVGRGMQPGRGGPQAVDPGRGGPGRGGPVTAPGRGNTGPGRGGTGPGGGPARGGFSGGRGQ